MNQDYLIIFFCLSICSTVTAVYMWISAKKETDFFKAALRVSQENEKELRRLLTIEEGLSAPAELQELHRQLTRDKTKLEGELLMGMGIVEQQRGTINNLQVLLNRCNSRWAHEKRRK